MEFEIEVGITSYVTSPSAAVGNIVIPQSNRANVPLTFMLKVTWVAVVLICLAVNSGALNPDTSWIINPDPETKRTVIAISEKINFENSIMKKITNEEV